MDPHPGDLNPLTEHKLHTIFRLHNIHILGFGFQSLYRAVIDNVDLQRHVISVFISNAKQIKVTQCNLGTARCYSIVNSLGLDLAHWNKGCLLLFSDWLLHLPLIPSTCREMNLSVVWPRRSEECLLLRFYFSTFITFMFSPGTTDLRFNTNCSSNCICLKRQLSVYVLKIKHPSQDRRRKPWEEPSKDVLHRALKEQTGRLLSVAPHLISDAYRERRKQMGPVIDLTKNIYIFYRGYNPSFNVFLDIWAIM